MPEGRDDLLDGEAQAQVAEGPALSLFGSISVLTVITILVAASSECAAASLQQPVHCERARRCTHNGCSFISRHRDAAASVGSGGNKSELRANC